MRRLYIGFFLGCMLNASWGASAARGEDPVSPLSPNPNGISFSRVIPEAYNPDSPLEVQITISAENAGGITAIGMYEAPPEAWVFIGVRAIANEPPYVFKQDPATGVLEFAWITPPNFPLTFAYTLQVPPPGPESNGTKIITGQLEYRTDSGRLVTTPVITTLEGADFLFPVISLYGDNPITLQRGDTYFEPGYTASDNGYDLPSTEVRVDGDLNTSIPGTYYFTYSIKDPAGNESSAVRVIIVEPQVCALIRAVCDFFGSVGF